MYSVLLPLLLAPSAVKADAVAAGIDERIAKHWQTNSIKPADPCSDTDFLRRVALDLAGRIPTIQEAKAFAAEKSADKRSRAIRRLMESPEYALHLGRILDDIVQEKYAGDGEFLDYLRMSVAKHKPWDQVFREVMLGPWDDKERKGASQFLIKRIKSLDELTTDTSRVFFGVNISCAQCHDHPLVLDWKQDHYYGMASFFNRTAGKGGKGNTGGIEEKTSGEVMFNPIKGERRTAKMMFLSSKIVDENEAKKTFKGTFSRREQLVKIALEERTFFSRAIVNQLWAFLLGRGIVAPTDQLHSANVPAVAGLLEWLADDCAANGYDLDRLIAAIVSSRVYQMAGIRTQEGKSASERDFAVAQLRSLTPQQLAVSLMLATGDMSLDTPNDRGAMARNLEREAGRLTRTKLLDARSDRYQTSTGEALFMSNHSEVQRLVEPAKTNLVGRLAGISDTKEIVDTAVWTVLSRAPETEEREFLLKWVESKPDRARGCRQLVWALMTSAEFRFNH